jgi:putative hydrolase of the HAD superfamily
MNIIFDFGNVLFEWNPVRLLDEHFLGKQSVEPRGALNSAALAETLINHQDWLDFDLGRLNSDALAARSAARLSLHEPHLRAFIERIPHVLPTIDPTITLFNHLADDANNAAVAHRLLYLSNMPAPFIPVLMTRCPWIARFDGGIFSGRVNLAKPDTAIYALAERRLNLIPSETLFLDDSPRNVDAARARGWCAEIITDPQSACDALTKHGVLR